EDPLYTVDRLTPPGRERLPDIVAHEQSATVVVRRRQRRVVMSQITRRRDRRSEAFEQRGPAIRWNWIHLGGLGGERALSDPRREISRDDDVRVERNRHVRRLVVVQQRVQLVWMRAGLDQRG